MLEQESMLKRLTIFTILALLPLAGASEEASEEIEAPDFTLYENIVSDLASQPEDEQTTVLFDGEASLDVMPNPMLDLQGNGSIDFFIAVGWNGDMGYPPSLIALRDADNTRYSIHLTETADGIVWWNGSAAEMLPFPFYDGFFHHVVLVTAGNETTAYVDGNVIGTFKLGYGQAQGLPLHIGTADGLNEGFIGAMASIRFWDTALNANDVVAIAEFSGAPDAQNPLFKNLVALSDFSIGGAEILVRQ